MPSQVPSSFASAAGSGSSREPRNSRADGRATDWSAQRTRGTNGTVTLRRSSTTPYAKSTADSETQHGFGANHLVEVFRKQDISSKVDVSHLFTNSWDPGHTNGANGRGWGKNTDRQDSNAPESCWSTDGKIAPRTLEEKTDLERSLFDTDVNSPMKPPPQNKETNGQGLGANGRKASIGQNSSPFGISSPSSSRPGTRRQQTTDSVTGLGSPAGNGRFARDDNNTSFSGRMLSRDGPDDRAENPFRAGLIRSNTGGSGLGNGPASPSTWGNTPSSATLGSFGHFALGGSGTPLTPGEKKAPFGSSRFGKLMTKESSEDMPSKAAAGGSWRGRQRTDTTDTDPYGSDNATGSAALGGGQDTSPPFNPSQRAPGMETPVRGASSDFGMSDMSGFRDARAQSHQTPQGRHGQEPLSPIDTNPYRSPPENETERDDESFNGDAFQQGRSQGLGGIPEHGPGPFGHLPRGFPNAGFDGSDRSQTSSVGGNKPFPPPLGLGGLPSLSGLGSIGGWPSSATVGTPDRENRSAFGGAFGNNPAFGPTGDLQSPGFSAMSGGAFGTIPTTAPAPGNSRRLASFLPPAMQAQMQAAESESPVEGGHSSAFGTIGRTSAFPRDTDSPLRTGRSVFDDTGADNDSARSGGFFSTDVAPGQTATSFPQGPSLQTNFQQGQGQGQAPSIDSAVNQLPSSQQRTMVMPDRMRWVYLDPQGQIQGPWSGLEMHDWYKANFFTADLSVRKLEDTEFEPLGQLIRRIGNSREPFLVPQIGIPHGPPAAPAGTPFTPTAAPGNSATQTGSVQPPFAGAFPSFGTTLTAEQQNNLERRKQEEQYLMARQREFLQQQQSMKQMQMSGVPSALHHQSSAHSLQSQPSFGSMTSPIGMPTQPPVPGVAGFFDGPPRQAPTSGISDFLQQEDINRLSLQDRQQQLFGSNIPASQGIHAQQINALFGQPSDVQQRDAARVEQARQEPRFREWEQLRSQTDIDEAGQPSAANMLGEPIAPPHQQQYSETSETQFERPAEVSEVLSLSQQIQKTASTKQSPTHAAQPESPWGKVDTNLPMPFPPPPQSTTPLPAPTAQRGRSNLPEALTMDERSRSETPEITTATPSIAPWAKESTEASRGPSLKEIQEAEAKKAAKDEEKAAATRRALHEQEMRLLTTQPVAPAPGLPSSSTWGNNGSPAMPSAPSPWATKAPVKVQPSSSAASKKTLADIQREEELRKQKLAAATVVAQPAQGSVGGKRYADLASKSTAIPATLASPWATVGAGGKVKVPTGPAGTAPQAARSTSSAAVPTVASRAARPTASTRSVTTSGQSAAMLAKDEFKKWVKTSLTKGLPSTVNVDDFAATISDFDPELMVEAVYGASEMAMDGRHFAEEYQRRRKLADKGVIEPSSTGSGTTFSTGAEKASGWSEVAKKGPAKEESSAAGYKVVPNKKKGGKK